VRFERRRTLVPAVLRLPTCLALGVGVASVLFGFMHALIGRRADVGEARSAVKIEFSRLVRESPVEPRKPPKPQREAPKAHEAPPGLEVARSLDPNEAVAALIPEIDPGLELGDATSLGAGGGGGGGGGGEDAGSGDRDVLPLVRIDPEYPPRAKQQGIGGYVTVEFTISPSGAVQDLRVIESQPAYVFDEAVLAAVRRWRYNPRVENGVAVARRGVKTRLVFEPGGRG
jgi:protein TonB